MVGAINVAGFNYDKQLKVFDGIITIGSARIVKLSVSQKVPLMVLDLCYDHKQWG